MVGLGFVLVLLLICSIPGGWASAEAEAAYEQYLIDLGENARKLSGIIPNIGEPNIVERGERNERADTVTFTRELQNITVPSNEAAQMNCEALNAERVDVMPRAGRLEAGYFNVVHHSSNSATLEVLEALPHHEGWYVCAAVGADGRRVFSEAYITVRDVCGESECAEYEVCEPDEFAGTYVCTCNIPCTGLVKEPVCGTDCVDHHSECEMLETACLNKIAGVKIVKIGKCEKEGAAPTFVLAQPDITFQEGSDVILRVHAVGTPDPSYRWFGGNGSPYDDANKGDTVLGTMTGVMAGKWTVEATNCHINSINTTFTVTMKSVPLEKPTHNKASVCGMSHVTAFSGATTTYQGLGTYLLAEVGTVLVYGTFKYCNTQKTGTCMHSLTVHRDGTSIQLVAFNTISNNGESVIVISSQTLGGVIVSPAVVGYTVIAGDVTVQWDGALGYDVLIDCSTKTEGVLGNGGCDSSSTTEDGSGKKWFIDDYSGTSTGLDVVEQLDMSCPAAEEYKSSCSEVLGSAFFSNCLSVAALDTEALLQACVHDSCRGLGCLLDTCTADKQLLSPVCSLAAHLTRSCSEWGMFIPEDWREIFKCENLMKTPPSCTGGQFYTE